MKEVEVFDDEEKDGSIHSERGTIKTPKGGLQ